jgi:sugar lactone lactonase YvrE
MIYTAAPATEPTYDLAEGIIWDEREGLARWVDLREGRVLAGKVDGDRLVVTSVVEMGQSAAALAMAEDGGILVAGARGLATISPAGQISFGPDLLGQQRNMRLNDGTADMFGAFVVGSLTIGGYTGQESLLRIFPNGKVETLRTGVRLSNGIAFSPDGETIYHVDTAARTVSSHPYGFDPLSDHQPWVTVLNENDLPTLADGLTVDSEGMLWVALFGGSEVRRYTPLGELLDTVSVDATQVTCPGFVGPDLDRLAISTAREGLESSTSGDGAIFLADVGTTGMHAHRWAGSTTTPYWLLPEGETV